MEHRFIVHCLAHAEAAVAAAAERGVGVTLLSPTGAAAYLGTAVFREMVDLARETHPDTPVRAVLDCGDDPALALNAFRQGIKAIRIGVHGDVRRRLVDIAAQCGAGLDDEDTPALDLDTVSDPGTACREWFDRHAVKTRS